MNNYQDIINLPHHTSNIHPRMPMNKRAAQFMPFAALTGYDDAIVEASRLTSQKIELSDDERDVINHKIQVIQKNLHHKIKVKITYFVADKYKVGGSYQNLENIVKRIDENNHIIIMADNTKIIMDSIIDLEIIQEK